MKSHSLGVWGALAGLVATVTLAGCAGQSSNERYAQSNLQTSPDAAQLLSYRIRNWSAPNDRTLILEAYDGTRYKAEMLSPCFGLNFAQRLAFTNRGGFSQIDQFSSVVLPDGTRCAFQSFNKVVTPESKALDSFEKLSETHGSGSNSKQSNSPR